ncbi:hypothetical protein QBC34DRAFT_152132 [Podospora aff. communis PSN243]|uniref:tyrosinase n=1 Tax=Podospora aff. communis PSN243 TaxID=3040156 RepID=A0AAV9GFL8_9PEZI|nr:hypothetical protein QBC34DRAFT_152132 [Podospora aff. communis PSN243]
MGLTQEQALAASKQGVVVNMKDLTGLNVDVERVDIDVLLTEHPDTFNLMLQALKSMQEQPVGSEDSKTSWFQLAGIHGFPRALWDNVGQQTTANTWDNNSKTFGSMGGYCAHGVLTFGTWHRPYLALLEQTIYRNMRDIANKYTDSATKQRYLEATQKFRLPYFDYFRARGRGYQTTSQDVRRDRIVDPDAENRRAQPDDFGYDFRIPDIFMAPEVTVLQQPDNKPVSIDNPLYTYKFSSQYGELVSRDKDALAGFASTEMTIRCQSRNNPATPKKIHNDTQLRYNLNRNVKDRVNMLLAFMNDPPYRQWQAIATDSKLVGGDFTETRGEGKYPSGSLEGLHNWFHGIIGFGGHMGAPQFAAFDPIFWFHHCNIDRYFALWQAANPPDPSHPERWFPAKSAGTTYDGEKPLIPFYKTRTGVGQGTYWTSDDVRQTQALGYIYDDFSRLEAEGGNVGRYMGKRYDWATRKPNSSDPTEATIPILEDQVKATFFFKPPSALQPAPERAALLAPPPEPAPAPPPLPLNEVEDIFDRDWYVDSKVKRMAANGSFTIYFFLSPKAELPDDDPFLYASSPYLVGMHHIFTSPREGCDNCADAEAAGRLSVNTTPITSSLLEYRENVADNGVDSLRPEHIKPFLQERLRWRVVFEGFNRQDPRKEDLELKVGVSAKIYRNDGPPTYEDYPDVVDAILANASPTASA